MILYWIKWLLIGLGMFVLIGITFIIGLIYWDLLTYEKEKEDK